MKHDGVFSAVNCDKTVLRSHKIVLTQAINHQGNKPATNIMIDESEEFMQYIHL
jgi:hypothetical protein